MVFGTVRNWISTMSSSPKSPSQRESPSPKQQDKQAKRAKDKKASKQSRLERSLPEFQDPDLVKEREEFRAKYAGVTVPPEKPEEGEIPVSDEISEQGLPGLYSPEELSDHFAGGNEGLTDSDEAEEESENPTPDDSSEGKEGAKATSVTSNKSEKFEQALSEQEMAAIAQYEHLMNNAFSVTSNYADFVKRLVTAGMRHPDPIIAETWSGAEPTVAELLKRFPIKVGKALVGMVPCSHGEFFNRVLGMHEGLTWHMGETLEQVQDELSHLVDSLKTKIHVLEQREEAHHAQTIKFADQVSNASASLAISVKNAETTFIKMADFAMRLPVQVDAPSKPSSVTVGDSVFRAPTRRRAQASSPTSSVRSALSVANPPEPPLIKESEARKVVTNIDRDGVYEGEQMAVTIENGRVARITVTSHSLRSAEGLLHRKAALAQMVLARSPEELRRIFQDLPDWLAQANQLKGQAATNFLIHTFPPSKTVPRWSWTPRGG